jgi:hypothetical protein
MRTLMIALVVVFVPVLCGAQAFGVSRPPTILDNTWLERQCATLKTKVVTNDAAKAGLDRARSACDVYLASSRDQSSRDGWLRAMLAIQDNVGETAMRALVPQFSGRLPAGFETYSLFLVPDVRWRTGEFAKYQSNLWQAAHNFGQSIGDTHVAIWFLDDEDNVDVLRSQEYCRRFGLSYNDGPYVVTVRKRPDLLTANDEVVVIRMGGVAPSGIVAILNRLSQDLKTTGRPATGRLLYEEIKERVLALVQKYPEGARAFLSAVLGL